MADERGTDDDPRARMAQHGRELRDNGKATLDAANHLAADVTQAAERQLRTHPYATLGAALGAGLVLGGGIPPRVVSAAAALGLRIAIGQVARGVLGSVDGAGSTTGSE